MAKYLSGVCDCKTKCVGCKKENFFKNKNWFTIVLLCM